MSFGSVCGNRVGAMGFLGAMLVAGLAAGTASAAPIVVGFGTSAEYDDNFREILGGASLGWDAAGTLLRTSSGTSVSIYDRTSELEKDTFEDIKVSLDFTISANTSSVGIHANVPTATENTSYLALVHINSVNDFLRIYEGGSPTTGAAGTERAAATPAPVLSVNTWYTLVFSITKNGSDLDLKASVFSIGETPAELITVSFTDTTPTAGPGQVGFRLNGATSASNIRADNFTVDAVPEPATAAVFATGSVLALGRRRRVAR